MRTLRRVLAVLTLLGSVFPWQTVRAAPVGPPSIATTRDATSPTRFAPGEVLVKFRDAADAAEVVSLGHSTDRTQALQRLQARRPHLAAALDRLGVRAGRRPFARIRARGLDRIVTLVGRPQMTDAETDAFVAELRQRPEIAYAERNVLLSAVWTPNDTYVNTSGAWGQSFADLWGLDKLQASTAWDSTRGAGVVVAVVDTGLDFAHEDIAANVWLNVGETGTDAAGRDRQTNGVDDDGNGFVDDWRGWRFIGAGSNDPTDDHGHGTHVAGTIAAVGDNGLGIVGVAPQARVMAIKALDANGSGTVDQIAAAIVYAANSGAHVINASLGAFGATPQVLIDAVAYVHDVKGAVFVAAAGNSNTDVGTSSRGFFPANIPEAIAVSAVDHLDNKASFSNFGARIDVAAPGGGDTEPIAAFAPHRSILSLKSAVGHPAMIEPQLVVGARYLRQAGTSMAAPHVAGVAALVRARHPQYSPEQVRQALRAGADDIGTPGFDAQSGYGRANAARAAADAEALAARLRGEPAPVTSGTPVEVRGTVDGIALVDWSLEYGVGVAPTHWVAISGGITPVREAVLGTWATAGVPDGAYVVRLSARNTSGRVYEDRLAVVVDSVSIASITRTTAGVSLYGSVNPAGFTGYSVTVASHRSGPLPNPNVTLPSGGQQPVVNGLLATWDTAGVTPDYYRICIVTSGPSSTSECTDVLVDPAVRDGWPRDLKAESFAPGFGVALTDHLTTADLDGDGGQEVVVAYGRSVHVFRHDGSPLPGWPQLPDMAQGTVFQKGPAVGDLTGDGVPEVAAVNNVSRVFIWDAAGRLLAGWPRPIFGSGSAALVIDDLDGDGRKELIAAGDLSFSTWISVFDVHGQRLPGWPRSPGWSYTGSIAVGDVDGDGRKDVIVQADAAPNPIHVFKADGTPLPGWPRSIDPGATERSYSHPAVGDLNGDGAAEIVVGSHSGYIHALQGNGTSLPGWPQRTVTRANSPVIGDIDGDGRPEVVAGTGAGGVGFLDHLYAWRADGTLLPGWPVKSAYPRPVAWFGYSTPILADLDGDDRADVIAASDVGLSQLDAFRYDGARVAGFPRPTKGSGGWGTNSAAVADVDGDGRRELAWINDLSVVVWNLGTPVGHAAPWPMFRRDAGHTASLRTNRAPVADAGGPYRARRQEPIAFDGSGSRDADGDPLTYLWDFGDGTTATGRSPVHAYTAPGTYTASLVVSDGAASSSPATAQVTILRPPTVVLTSPPTQTIFVAPADLTLAAEADDPDGTIARVDFFAGPTKLGEDTTPPFGFAWAGVPAGTYSLTASATDDSGDTAVSAPVTVIVNAPPTVTLTAPLPDAAFVAPATVMLAAAASDADGSVTQVEFLAGDTLLGIDTTSPFEFTWVGVPRGRYSLTARVTDDRGTIRTSAAVPIVVATALRPSADAYVRDGSSSGSNFGTSTVLQVKQGGSGNRRWTYLKFDTTSVAQIQSARLRLYGQLNTSTAEGVRTSVFSAANTSWTEGGIRWNNRPSTRTTPLASVDIVNNSTVPRWYEWDVTAYLQSEKAAGRSVVTLVLKNDASSNPFVSFPSKEALDHRPELVLTP